MMMSKKSEHPKISIHSASQRAPLNLNVNYVTVMKYTCTYQRIIDGLGLIRLFF